MGFLASCRIRAGRCSILCGEGQDGSACHSTYYTTSSSSVRSRLLRTEEAAAVTYFLLFAKILSSDGAFSGITGYTEE
jgi:hypothetical protein